MDIWYVWTIVQQRHKRVSEFLKNLEGISEYFYPTVIKEYNTKSGKKNKDIPLFSNYIFIKYTHSNYLQDKISSNPWIKECLGKCSQKEMDDVLILSKRKYEDLIPTNEILKNHSYKLKGTPFKGMTCTVVNIEGDKVAATVSLFGSERLIKCSTDDIALEG
jgi:transcription antitermination factor NusG